MMSKTYEILFIKKDRSVQRTEWVHKPFFQSMKSMIGQQIKRGEEIGMIIRSIKRIY